MDNNSENNAQKEEYKDDFDKFTDRKNRKTNTNNISQDSQLDFQSFDSRLKAIEETLRDLQLEIQDKDSVLYFFSKHPLKNRYSTKSFLTYIALIAILFISGKWILCLCKMPSQDFLNYSEKQVEKIAEAQKKH